MSDRGAILIVTDDAATEEALRVLLEDGGYTVGHSGGELQDLETAGTGDADLVLLDAHLEHHDPFELLERLREHEPGRDVPVIFISTSEDSGTRIKGLTSGDDVIVEPFDTHEVLARIERQVTVSKVRMALRESEAKFRSVMESAIDAIISGDAEGRIRSWNSAATALFGFTEEEVLGEPIEVIIPERYRDQHRQGIRRVTEGGPSHVIGSTVELAAIRKDGSEFPVELSLATWLLDDERYYTGIIRDISERKQAEQKFRSVTDSAIDAIISADHHGEIVSWNKAATRILGYSEEEAVGERLELIIPERFHQAHREGMARFTTTGEAHVIGTTVELFARTKSGEEVPIELSLSTWTVKDERYYTGIIRDIGERKRAEEALRRSEQELRERTEELEETLSRLNEMQNQLILQEKMASLGKLSAGMAHELNNPVSAARSGAAQLHETFLRWQETQLGLAELDLDPAQVERIRELDRAVRERVHEHAELSALERSDREVDLEGWMDERQLDTETDVVSELVGMGVTRQELASLEEILAESQVGLVIQWLALNYAMHDLLDQITRSTDRIVEIVTALKTYTYRDQAPVQTVDLATTLDSTLTMFESRLEDGITVDREYADDLPAVQTYAGELNQVWTTLIDNALDAMAGDGTLVVRTRAEGPWAVVEIEDSGPGIPEDVRSKIFDPFFTTKGPGEGTGLGLNIAHNLVVQRHQGEISVESEPGRTRFTIRIPKDLELEG